MLLVQVTLDGGTGESGTEAEANVIQDSLWAHAGRQHGLEHVRVRAAPYGIDLVLFIRAESHSSALLKAQSLFSQALRTPAAAGYSVAFHCP